MELNENQIIASCQSGDWQNFDLVYDQYLPKIYQFVYHRVRHKQTAEDLTSVIFLKVVQNLSSYRIGKSPFGAWIYRIARNTVIDHVRAHKSTVDLEAAAYIASKEDVMNSVDSTIKLEAIRKGLVDLTEQQREVLTMRVWDELTHQEIADILEISEGSSKVTFGRAIEALKQTINI